MRKVLLGLAFLAWASFASAYTETFYVCEGGDGTLPETNACATAYDAADFNTGGNWAATDTDDGKIGPNDTVIILDDGGPIRASLTAQEAGLSGSPIIIQGESGGDATVTGTDVMSTWEVYGAGAGSTWQKTGVTTEPNQVFLGGTRIVEGSGTDVLDDHEWIWSVNVLYFRDDTGDPDGSGVLIEASQRSNLIQWGSQKHYVTFQNFTVWGSQLLGVFANGTLQNIGIRNITSKLNYAAGISAIGNTSFTPAAEYGIIDSCTVYGNGGSGILIQYWIRHWTVSNNSTHHNGWRVDYSAGIKVIATGGGAEQETYGHIIENNYVHHEGKELSDDSPIAGTYNGNGIHIDTAGSDSGASPITVRYNSSAENKNIGLFVENTPDADVYYNISYANDEQGIGGDSNSATYPNEGNEWYNNVSYGNGSWGLFNSGASGGAASCVDNTFKNNISVDNAGVEFRPSDGGENDGTEGSGNVYEYNSFGVEATDFLAWGAGNPFSTYDAWLAASSQTDTNVETDPLFTDAANADFTLTPESPAREAGTDVSLSPDIAGHTVPMPEGGVQDIGAYEFFIEAVGFVDEEATQ